jgi:hypothetical protein
VTEKRTSEANVQLQYKTLALESMLDWKAMISVLLEFSINGSCNKPPNSHTQILWIIDRTEIFHPNNSTLVLLLFAIKRNFIYLDFSLD